jgi:hypothetical protein
MKREDMREERRGDEKRGEEMRREGRKYIRSKVVHIVTTGRFN